MTTIRRSFFLFFPSAAWLGFTASAPVVVYHGWPTMLQRSASVCPRRKRKKRKRWKTEVGESGFSSSLPRSLLLRSHAVVSITTNQSGGRQPLQCSLEESCMCVVFFWGGGRWRGTGAARGNRSSSGIILTSVSQRGSERRSGTRLEFTSCVSELSDIFSTAR